MNKKIKVLELGCYYAAEQIQEVISQYKEIDRAECKGFSSRHYTNNGSLLLSFECGFVVGGYLSALLTPFGWCAGDGHLTGDLEILEPKIKAKIS